MFQVKIGGDCLQEHTTVWMVWGQTHTLYSPALSLVKSCAISCLTHHDPTCPNDIAQVRCLQKSEGLRYDSMDGVGLHLQDVRPCFKLLSLSPINDATCDSCQSSFEMLAILRLAQLWQYRWFRSRPARCRLCVTLAFLVSPYIDPCESGH